MNQPIILCAKSFSLQHPEDIGLCGENFAQIPWIKTFSSAYRVREFLKLNRQFNEIWIASSDDVDPINIVAALRRDIPSLKIYLLGFTETGSLISRANNAGATSIVSFDEFRKMFYERQKQDRVCVSDQNIVQAQLQNKSITQSQQSTQSDACNICAVPSMEQNSESNTGMSNWRAFVMPVLSGSGGAGKSTVAVMCALIAQRAGFKTLIMDCDFQFGDIKEMLGVETCYGIDDAIDDLSIVQNLHSQETIPAILGAPKYIEYADQFAARISAVLKQANSVFDVVIVNTGSFWTEQHIAILEASSKALFLVDQRPSSLRACKRVIELCNRCNIATNPFIFAANNCTRTSLYTSIDISCAMHGASAYEIKFGGFEVEEVCSLGRACDLVSAQNDLCSSVVNMMKQIFPKPPIDASINSVVQDTKKDTKHFLFKKGRRTLR